MVTFEIKFGTLANSEVLLLPTVAVKRDTEDYGCPVTYIGLAFWRRIAFVYIKRRVKPII